MGNTQNALPPSKPEIAKFVRDLNFLIDDLVDIILEYIYITPTRRIRTISGDCYNVINHMVETPNYLVSVTYSGNLITRDLKTFHKISVIPTSSDRFGSIIAIGKGSCVAITTFTGNVEIWDVKISKLVRVIENLHARILKIFSCGLVIGCENGKLYLCENWLESKPVEFLNQHAKAVLCITEANDLIISIGRDNKFICWNVIKNECANISVSSLCDWKVSEPVQQIIYSQQNGLLIESFGIIRRLSSTKNDEIISDDAFRVFNITELKNKNLAGEDFKYGITIYRMTEHASKMLAVKTLQPKKSVKTFIELSDGTIAIALDGGDIEIYG